MAVDFDDLFLQAGNMRNNAEVDKAIAAYADIAILANEQKNTAIIARALHLAGVSALSSINSKNSYFEQALVFFNKSEELYKELGDLTGLGALYRDMALACDNAREVVKALPYFQQSIATLERAGAPEELAITYDKIGVHFYKTGQYDVALQYTDKALELFRRAPAHGFFYATTLFDRARIFFKKGNLEEAKELGLESLGYFEADHGEEKYDHRKAQLNGFLAVVYGNLNDNKSAKKYAEQFRSLCANFQPLAYKIVQAELDELTK